MAQLTLHGQGCAHRKQQTSLEGTAQPRLTVPLLVTDGPVAAFGGCFGAVTPDAQLVSTALAVPGTEGLLVPARLAGVLEAGKLAIPGGPTVLVDDALSQDAKARW